MWVAKTVISRPDIKKRGGTITKRGMEALEGKPYLLFINHASMVDFNYMLMAAHPARVNNVITPKLKLWIGYDQDAYPEGRHQTERAQKWIFAMSTLFPAFLSMTSVIPMFFYKIDKATRDRMYAELNARRSAMAEQITEAGSE